MTNQEFTNGLRAIAAWYEEHEDAPIPVDPSINVTQVDESKEGAARIIRMLGACDKVYGNRLFTLSKDFGGIMLKFMFWRDSVCTRRVVGKKVVPARPAVPAVPETEEDIVEWDCPESLLEPNA